MKIIIGVLFIAVSLSGMEESLAPQKETLLKLKRKLESYCVTSAYRRIYMTVSPTVRSLAEGEETRGDVTVRLYHQKLVMEDIFLNKRVLLRVDGEDHVHSCDEGARFALSDNGHILVIINRGKVVGFSTEAGRTLFVIRPQEVIRDAYMYGNALIVHTEGDEGHCIEKFEFNLRLRHQIKKLWRKRWGDSDKRLLELVGNSLENDQKVRLREEERQRLEKLLEKSNEIQKIIGFFIE